MIATICELAGVPEDAVLSKSRVREVVYARMLIANYLVHEQMFSASRTARALGITHATVIYYLKRIENRKFDAELNHLYLLFEEHCITE